MVERGLLMDDDTLMTAKEINEFKSRVQGTHLLRWLHQLTQL